MPASGVRVLTALTGNEYVSLETVGGVDVYISTANFLAGTGSSNPTYGNLTLTGLLFESNQASITAGTTRTQTGATALTKEVNRVDTSTAPTAGTTLGDGVALPASAAGLDITVINNTTNIIQVYGILGGSDTINGVAGSTGVPIPPGDVAQFECAVAGAWFFEAGVGASGQYPIELAADSISAGGTTQGTSVNLTAVYNRVTTATANQGVRLPASAPGMDIFVENHSGQPITVYGGGTDKIDDVASAIGVTQMDSSVVIFTCYAAGNWYSNGLATGYAKNPQSGTVLETMQFADAISAAGSGQSNGTQLLAGINTVSTVSAGQGVNLPASAPGLQVTIINTSTNTLQVYPAIGASDTINGVAATIGVALLPGSTGTFNCTAAGAWNVMPGSTIAAAYNTSASAVGFTATGAQFSGGFSFVELDLTGNPGAGATLTTPTGPQIIAALHSPVVGTTYVLRIKNSANTNTWTVTANATGVSVNGTNTIATGTWRDFMVKVATLTTVTMQNLGGGATL